MDKFKAPHILKIAIKINTSIYIHKHILVYIDRRILKFWRRLFDIYIENIYPYLVGGMSVLYIDFNHNYVKLFLKHSYDWDCYKCKFHQFDFSGYIKYFYSLVIENLYNREEPIMCDKVRIIHRKPRFFLYKKKEKLIIPLNTKMNYECALEETKRNGDFVLTLAYGRKELEVKNYVLLGHHFSKGEISNNAFRYSPIQFEIRGNENIFNLLLQVAC